MKKVILTVLFFLFSYQCSLAQRKIAYGFLVDSMTNVVVANANIENISANYVAKSNRFGRFGVKADVGDSLRITATGYSPKILCYGKFLHDLDTFRVLLQSEVAELAEVVVTGYTYEEYQADSTQRSRDFFERNGAIKSLFEPANSGHGLGISLDRLFSKAEKEKRRAYKVLQDKEKDMYVKFRYNPSIVQHITGLRGDALANFIRETAPTYEWLRKHTTREDIFFYINEQLKKSDKY